jgi:bacterioferritin (cytochrome b1)
MTPSAGAPLAVIDTLNSLLEFELHSLFRQLQKYGAHLDRAHADLRRPLTDMAAASVRHGDELATLIESLGGAPVSVANVSDEQYLAYLSFKFFLPKLIEACRQAVERYANAITALGGAPEPVGIMLRRHAADYQAQLALLEQAAARH